MSPLCIAEIGLDQERKKALLGMADVVCLRHETGETSGILSRLLQPFFTFDLLTLAQADPLRQTIKIDFWKGNHKLFGPIEVGAEDSAAGLVWRDQTVLNIKDVSAEKRFQTEIRCLTEYGIKSYCLLPLTSFREKLGALGFANLKLTNLGFADRDLHSPNSHDIAFLQCVAVLVALSIDNSLSDLELRGEVERLRLLIELSDSDLHNLDSAQFLASMLQLLQRSALQDMVGIYVYDEATKALRLQTPDPELAEKMAPEGGLTPIEGTLAGQAFSSRRTMILDYPALTDLPFASVRRGIELGVRSLCLCPLILGQEALGVLKVARRRDLAFSARDIEFLEQVAARTAALLHETARGIETKLKNGDAQTNSNRSAFALAPGISPSSEESTSSEPVVAKRAIPFSLAKALMGSEELLAAYFRASDVGFAILDERFRYVAVNERLAAINNFPPAAHLGKTVREVLGDFAELVEPYLQKVLDSGEPVADLEVSSMLLHRPDPGHFIIHYVPVKDQGGNVRQIGAVVIETTEQKKLEESLRSVSENLRQEKKRQEVFVGVARVLVAQREIGKMFRQISACLRRVLRQEYAALVLRDDKSGDMLPPLLDFPMGKSAEVGSEIGAAKSAAGKALLERSPLIFSRDEIRRLDPAIARELASEGLKSLCCVPLLRQELPLGVLVLGSTRADAFRHDDLALLTHVAEQLATALENEKIAREVDQLKRRLKQEKRYLQGEFPSNQNFGEIIGESPALKQVLEQVAIISSSDVTVLILGETGTGKGLIARAVHRTSKRSGRSFVTLNCAAIPTGLLESELFGHEKGAFTGAVSQKIGRLELADGGTLFLDEIGEIPLEMQPKLLRVLQDHEFERLGGTRTIKVNLRLIAATNRDLANSVAQKQFRSDLFYRLNVFPVRLPSLRERTEDIPLLVRYFVRKFSRAMSREIETIPTETMDALVRWHWPGNVRELENFIERSVILTEGSALHAPLEEFHLENAEVSQEHSLEKTERDHIIRVLREANGVLGGPTGAASRLGLKRSTLQSKMQRLEIRREDYIVKSRTTS